jgi:hypothetical protein
MNTEEGGEDRPGWQEQIDALSGRMDRNRADIERMQAEAEIDRKVVEELHADGLLERRYIQQLEEALAVTRRIGAAIGIIMAARDCTQEQAFAILVALSHGSNQRLRVVAGDLVETGKLDA